MSENKDSHFPLLAGYDDQRTGSRVRFILRSEKLQLILQTMTQKSYPGYVTRHGP
jgi:hypothetical protein